MKRIFVVVILLTTSIAVFAQQSNTQRTSSRPTSEQTKENARQYLDEGKSRATGFDSMQADLNARNISNDDTRNFNQLKADIEKLEAQIVAEQNKVSATLDKGLKVSRETLDNVQRLIEKHKEKLAELESFSSTTTRR
jgi:biopolymer transport protein ExbB/TolQ